MSPSQTKAAARTGTGADDKNKRSYQVPAVTRAIDIIEFLGSRQEASFTEIFSLLGLPKSTAYQILNTLLERGYVRHSGGGAKFSLGLKLFEMGSLSATRLDVRTEALPVLTQLADRAQETCHLGVLDGTEGVYLAKVEGGQSIRLNSWEGKRLPLHCTSIGKAILAGLPGEERRAVLDRIELFPITPAAITDRTVLEEHLALVRERGWALDDQENEPHIRCVAAPVRSIDGAVNAAISLSGLATQFDGEYLLKMAELVQWAGEELSRRLGGKS